VSRFSVVRTYVLTDTVECHESRFAGLTSLTNYIKLRHYREMIEFVCEGILPYFLKKLINKNKSGI